MVPGIVLLIIGAVFTFALRTDGSWMNTRVLGVILMLGGVAFVVRALLGRRAVVVTEEEYDADGGSTDATHQRHVVIEKRQD